MDITNNDVIVVIAHYQEDLSWVSRIKYKHIVYSKTIKESNDNLSVIYQPRNVGNEASAYLQYIIDNYDTFPEYVLFVHGHDTSWHHDGSIVDIINNTELLPYKTLNKFPLYKLNPEGPDEKRVCEDIGVAFDNPPDIHNLYVDQCAMFCVSRDTIRSRPIEFYQKIQDYILTTTTPTYYSSRIGEYTYRWIFLQDKSIPT